MKRVNIYIVLGFQQLIAGGTHIVAKLVVVDVEPTIVLFLRTLISITGMLLIFFSKHRELGIEKKDWRWLVLLGFLGIPLNQGLYLYGMKYTTAANGALLYAATPSFVLLLSHYLANERITLRKSAGIFLAFIGIIIVIFEKGINISSEYTFGNILILVAVVAWALFTVMGKTMILKYGALRTTTSMMLAGTLMFLPIGVYESIQFPFSAMSHSAWWGVLYLGVGTSILGYLIWYYAIGRIETAKVAVFSNAQPIFATLLSLIFLDYSITGSFILGACITIAGVIITQLG
ncbi:MAG: DMT family transporter [bacterium]